MRHIFSAFGGNLGESGTVSNFAFDYRGVIVITGFESVEDLEMTIMETAAEDYEIEDGVARVMTDKVHFIETRKKLEEA